MQAGNADGVTRLAKVLSYLAGIQRMTDSAKGIPSFRIPPKSIYPVQSDCCILNIRRSSLALYLLTNF